MKAALRLGPKGFRHWLLRRVGSPPLAPPINLAEFTISHRDMAALLDGTFDRKGLADALAQDVATRFALKKAYWKWPAAWNRLWRGAA